MASRWNHPRATPLSEVVARHVVLAGECLVWQGRKHRGYGTMFWGESPRLRTMVAALLWRQHYGPLPPGKRLWNRCGNRGCVRLDHWGVRGMRQATTRARITVEYLVEVEGCIDARLLQTVVAGQLLASGLPVVDERHPVARSLVGGKPEPLLSVQVREDRPGFSGSTCLFNAATGKRRLVREGHLGRGPTPSVEEMT